MTTVDKVVSILTNGGYRSLDRPLKISNVPFEFAAALVAVERSLDLVVVIDLLMEDDESKLIQKVLSLARALDIADSRRSLTLVIVGDELSEAARENLSRVCRILGVGVPPTKGEDQYVRDWLAVLLPLLKPQHMSGVADWKAELSTQLREEKPSRYTSALTSAANQGAEAVESVLKRNVSAIIKKALAERADD